jgi:hypothetical protein
MKKNKNYELLKKVGDISQIAGVKKIEFCSGKAKGTEAFEVYNAAGLNFTVLADKCLDIFDLKYKGTNIGFTTKNGLVANKFFNALDNEFIYYWTAGMLYTCGLANTGPSCNDNGLYQTEHGRIGMTPANNISVKCRWENGDYLITISGEISGEMNESIVCGYNLKLTREISLGLYSKEIHIHDILENLEPEEEEFMLLYHLNFGYPIVDEGAYIVKPDGKIIPRTEEAKKGIESWGKIGNPIDGADEQVFFHELRPDKDGFSPVGIINKSIGMGAYVRYSSNTLPILVQ